MGKTLEKVYKKGDKTKCLVPRDQLTTEIMNPFC